MAGWRVPALGRLQFDTGVAVPALDPTDPDGVVIEVVAAGVNFADGLVVSGQYQERPPLPFTPGIEVAGVVRAAAGDAFGPGTRVVGMARFGTGSWAEVATADAGQLVALPDGLSFVDGIGLHVNAQTAWFALHRLGRVQPGETVLVHAAAGGVGGQAVQLARSAGCMVIGTASPGKLDLVRGLGADLAVDNRAANWSDHVRDVVGPIDVVVDPVGGPVFEPSWRLLGFEGRYVVAGFASGGIPTVKVNHALVKNVSLHGLYWARYCTEAPDLVDRAASEIFALAADGKLDPQVSVVAPLAEAAARSTDVADGRTVGKVVLVTPIHEGLAGREVTEA